MNRQLCEPILDNGIRNTNFFNGRLLAAEDLQGVQGAERSHRQQIGTVLGAGVVGGLSITIETGGDSLHDAVVSITPGLAVTARGDTLELGTSIDLVLAQQTQVASQAGRFIDCSTDSPGSLTTGVGIYALVISAASGFSGRAPMSGQPPTGGTITGCGSKYEVEGVAFRLVGINLGDLPGIQQTTLDDIDTLITNTNTLSPLPTDQADLSMLRNRLAHVCLGTEQLRAIPADPFAVDANGQSLMASYGIIDALDGTSALTPDDVPLAIVYWTVNGIRFIDQWSIRRRPATPAPAAAPWMALYSERRLREAEATSFQFQDQVHQLVASVTNLSSVTATAYFRYLPPAGMLPATWSDSPVGLDPTQFFGANGSPEIALLGGNVLRSLLHEALYHEPIDLVTAEQRIQRYWLWENSLALAGGAATTQRTLVFASPTLPYRGTARYALASWAFSRFPPAVT
jgi:hypothetical protein